MFEDLFSSSKGPGVIGLLLGLFVLAGFCGLGFAVFDGRLNGDFANRRQKEAAVNDSRIEDLEGKIKVYLKSGEGWKKANADAEKLKDVQRAIALRKPKIDTLKAAIAEEETKNEEVLDSWETYKEEYRAFARARMVGTTFDELTVPGRTYKKVKVTAVTPLEMKFSHADGVSGVKVALLDEKIKDQLQFSEEKAQEVADEIRKNTKILSATATAAQKVAAIKARISHYNLNIERNDKKIADNDRKKASNTTEAGRMRSRAREHWNKYREDRAAGRPSRADDNARAAEARADALMRANQGLNAASSKLRAENNELRNKIGEAEREKTKAIREAKEAKEEEAAKAAGDSASGEAEPE